LSIILSPELYGIFVADAAQCGYNALLLSFTLSAST